MNMSNVNVDQRREAIRAALRESPGISDRQLAKRLGMHHVTVGTQRKAMEAAGEIQRAATSLGADGKTYAKAKASRPKPVRAKANMPVSMARLVSTAMSNLLRLAKKERRMPELAQVRRAAGHQKQR
jgi:predicted ArsR family transcriptional regulator